MAHFEELSLAVQAGKAPDAERLTKEFIDSGTDPKEILDNGLLHGMSIIGGKFKRNEVFIPQVLIAARAMKAGMTLIEPLLLEGGVESKGKALIGTVKGDLHDIGKNLVVIMLKGAGYDVEDIGIDIAPEAFVEKVKEGGYNLVGLSALLTTTMPAMAETVKAFEESGIRDQVKIIIGGAPVTEEYAEQIGADGYAADAASAVDIFDKFNAKS
ncbi:MAG: corrinoid protein [Fibrobacterota bacterium]